MIWFNLHPRGSVFPAWEADNRGDHRRTRHLSVMRRADANILPSRIQKLQVYPSYNTWPNDATDVSTQIQPAPGGKASVWKAPVTPEQETAEDHFFHHWWQPLECSLFLFLNSLNQLHPLAIVFPRYIFVNNPLFSL